MSNGAKQKRPLTMGRSENNKRPSTASAAAGASASASAGASASASAGASASASARAPARGRDNIDNIPQVNRPNSNNRRGIRANPSPPAREVNNNIQVNRPSTSRDNDQAGRPNPGFRPMLRREFQAANGRKTLYFPENMVMTLRQKKNWTNRLNAAHRDFEVLFIEGNGKPHINVKGAAAVAYLTTEGFDDVVMHEKDLDSKYTRIIIFDVPVNVNVVSLTLESNIAGVERRFVRRRPKPQLLATVRGPVPDRVFLPNLGYKNVAVYTSRALFCLKCSKWGHLRGGCNERTYHCRFCAGDHSSLECLAKIKRNIYVPAKCCNCGEDHNANSKSCRMRPRISRSFQPRASRARDVAAAIEHHEPMMLARAAVAAVTRLAGDRRERAITAAILSKAKFEIETLKTLVVDMKASNGVMPSRVVPFPENLMPVSDEELEEIFM
ncbi:uncharacterized protein [Macrobrachium rosenbergii]|uniref:uncharacterized protein n=1 Tax=Macrobrachium rosenbergii TaxID=79674 RepID=UPI0034D3EB31